MIRKMKRCSQGTYKDSQTDKIPWRFPSHRWDANQDKVCYNKYPTETIKKGYYVHVIIIMVKHRCSVILQTKHLNLTNKS